MWSMWVECHSTVYRFVCCLTLLEHSPQHLIPEGKAFYKTLWFRRADSNASCCLAILTQADMTGRMLTCVDVPHCTCAYTGAATGLYLIVCVRLCVSPVFQPPCCHQASCVQWRPLSSLSDRHIGSQSPQSVPSRPPWTRHLRNPENEVRNDQKHKNLQHKFFIRRHCASYCVTL